MTPSVARSVVMTGASGYLGSRVHARLVAAGHGVVRLGRRGAEIDADLVAARPTWPALAAPATLLHCAGIMTAGADAVVGSARMAANLLDGLPEAIDRLVLVSSAYVYAPSAAPVAEDVPPAASDAYACSKVLVEELFRGFAAATGRALVVLRPCAIFGPDDPHQKAISRFVVDGRAGRAPTLKGPVSFQRDYIHVDDAARAVVLAVERAAAGTVYNVCTGKQWSAVELAKLLGELDPALRVATDAPDADPIGYRFDPGRAARDLDFRAAIDLRDAMRSMLESRC